MQENSTSMEISHHFKSIANIMRTMAQKYPAAADGFEEFQVRGSALRHMGMSIACMADQFDLAAEAITSEIPSAASGNMSLVGVLLEGCAFQLSHFDLSLASDHHHMAPMCGAHNARSPIREAGYMWAGIADVLKNVAALTKPRSESLS